ncbi:hypothetical protein MUB23_16215 [Cuneatibacter sp. NSJ-177]|nr:acyltransferase family protein [Cuneatibacter sp. NSJ-177]MCJ7836924.1 hypothetical protein [Cuneatibacter sp. NSJ-177]
MSVFFLFLSGYGLFMSFNEKGIHQNYWNDKIAKIFTPYWIVTICYFILIKGKDTSILLKNLLMVDFNRDMDATMWYMSLLIIWYFIFYILFKFEVNNIIRCFFMLLLASFILENSSYFDSCSWQFQQNAFSFPLGVVAAMIIHYCNDRVRVRKCTYIFLILPVLIIYGCAVFAKVSFQLQNLLLVLLMIIVVKLIIRFDLKYGFLSKLGTYSYPIYLIEGKLFVLLPRVNNSFCDLGIYFGGIMGVMLIYCFIIRKTVGKIK